VKEKMEIEQNSAWKETIISIISPSLYNVCYDYNYHL
jgi:hypothetical protein